MSSATLAASASPHSPAMRCSATSMPGRDAGARGKRAIDHEDPVLDHRRLRRQCAQRAQQLVVRGAAPAAEQPGPRGEQRARADRHQAMVARRRAQRLAETRAQPARRRRHRRRDVAEVLGRLTDHHDPGGRAELLRQRLQPGNRQPDRGRLQSRSARRSGARNRGGSPRRSRCWLARRNASAGPAMSSSNECGTITNRTSISWARVIICPKVIETCRSAMRQGHRGTFAKASACPRTRRFSTRRTCAVTFPRRVPLTMALLPLSFWPFSATEGRAQAARDRPSSGAGAHGRSEHRAGRRLLRVCQRRVAEGGRPPGRPGPLDGPRRDQRAHAPAGRGDPRRCRAPRPLARSPARWPTSAPPS